MSIDKIRHDRQQARIALSRHLTQEADRANRNGSQVALLHVEVDGAGEPGIDEPTAHAMVGAVQARLVRLLRTYDLVMRTGPRSLAAVLSDVRGGAPVLSGIVDRVATALEPPLRLSTGRADARCRIGAAAGNRRLPGPDLIRLAAVAVARAADAGGTAFPDEATDEAMRSVKRFHSDLRDAISGGLIDVAYQPLFDAGTDLPTGVEALARWTRDGRQVSPAEFIPHAEATGLMPALGEVVLRKACEAGSRWRNLVMAVNVSPAQLSDPTFPAKVQEILSDTGLEPERLELEVTEGMLVDDPEAASERLAALRSVGVRIALDDFGSGFSGLGYLKALPFDRVKIDRSFVADTGVASRAIIDAVLGMSRKMGFSVTAEGIETEAQRDYLVDRGCNRLQGYLLGRPMSEHAIDGILDIPVAPTP